MSKAWSLVRLDKILQLQRRWLKLNPTEMYTEIGIRSFGKGIFHKSPVLGASLGNKRVLQIQPGDIVFSNVFAWEGAVAVAGEAEAEKIGSHRFVTYTAIGDQCSVEYLRLFFCSQLGLEVLRRVSPGSAGRNRTLNIAQFAKQEIPLPSLEEQLRIVARVEELTGKIEEARSLRQQTLEETEALTQAVRRNLIGEEPLDSWVTLDKYVLDIENGKSPACEKRPAETDEWGVLKVGVVSSGIYSPTENKALPSTIKPATQYEVRPGDFLMSRANTKELVGSCAIVTTTRSKLLLSDKIFRFAFRKDAPIIPAYLNQVLKSPALRNQIEKAATGTSSSMKNISKQKVMKLLVPVKPLPEQQRIVAYLDNLQAKVDQMKRLREDAIKELDALLPSILDKAFKGEL
jgi:type I restriction enzyme S subunit